MYNFELYNPTCIVFGEDGRKKLGEVITKYGKRVLFIYGGKSISTTGLYDEVKKLLKASNIEEFDFGGVKSNPRHTMITTGGQVCREQHIDVILAVGGGSVIDCGKAISIAAYYEGDFWDIVEKKVFPQKALPLITVSTISGTGTEMNNSCVITNEDQKIKRGYNCELIRPKVSFLDPKLTFSVNAFQTACGAADTLSHILDTSYMVYGEKMEMLDDIMESICKTVVKYGPIAVEHPRDYEARANLMWAATWGLNGFLKNGIRQLAACHAIEHELSAQFDITHGLGMAIIMPYYYEYILNENNAHLYANIAKKVFNIEYTISDKEAAVKMLSRLRCFLFDDLKLPSRLSRVGINKGSLESIARNVCWGGTLPGLVTITTEDVFDILENAY